MWIKPSEFFDTGPRLADSSFKNAIPGEVKHILDLVCVYLDTNDIAALAKTCKYFCFLFEFKLDWREYTPKPTITPGEMLHYQGLYSKLLDNLSQTIHSLTVMPVAPEYRDCAIALQKSVKTLSTRVNSTFIYYPKKLMYGCGIIWLFNFILAIVGIICIVFFPDLTFLSLLSVPLTLTFLLSILYGFVSCCRDGVDSDFFSHRLFSRHQQKLREISSKLALEQNITTGADATTLLTKYKNPLENRADELRKEGEMLLQILNRELRFNNYATPFIATPATTSHQIPRKSFAESVENFFRTANSFMKALQREIRPSTPGRVEELPNTPRETEPFLPGYNSSAHNMV